MKEGWTYKKLGEVCEILNGFAFQSKNYVPEGIRVVRITNVQKGYIEDIDPKYYPIESKNELSRYLLKDGDLLLSLTGNVGRVAIIDYSYLPAYLNQRVACIRVKENVSLDLNFLFHLLYSKKFERDCIKSSKGAAQLNMSTIWLASYLIPVPSIEEQRSIVAYLDAAFAHIDALKANAEKQLVEARQLFQAELAECMRPKEGWEEKMLGEIATDIYRGSGIKRDQITKEGTPCVRYGEIYTTYNVAFDDCVSHTCAEIIQSPKYFEYGDLLFAITGESVEDIGKTIAYLGKDKCLLGGDIICMKHKQNPKFLSYAFSTPDAIRQKGIGKTKLKVVHTNAPALKAISIPIPPINIQQSIVSRLDALSANIKKLEEVQRKTLAECDALKQAMLREVFE